MNDIKQTWWERLWDFFSSLKLTFVILAALVLAAVLGTIIPQKQATAFYIEAFGQVGSRLFFGLYLHDLYHAPWFRFLLACLAANLIVCSLNRLPQTLAILKRDPQKQAANPPAEQEKHLINLEPKDAINKAESILQQTIGPVHHYKLKTQTILFAQKGGWSLWGVYVVHLSILVIFAGALLGDIWGYSGYLQLKTGEIVEAINLDNGSLKPLPYAVRLDEFQIDYYDNKMPKEYRSELTFIKNGQRVQQSSLRVNHPAKLDGIVFYQSSYGQLLESLTLTWHKENGGEVIFDLPHGRWTDLPGEPQGHGRQVLALDLHSDIRMGERYHGPAARLGYRETPDAEARGFNIFDQTAVMPQRGPLHLTITDFKETPYSGLQVKYDPGVWLIWLGCLLMGTGFVSAFYFSHNRVWIKLLPLAQGGVEAKIVVLARRHNARAESIKKHILAKLESAQPG